ncbi:HNH endonuclease [Candidatus Pacearchaeota archaeon]|jgi:hypothetical protein|nr:HNH endonuclease [Candidatus Pacearchaeota archaeon]
MKSMTEEEAKAARRLYMKGYMRGKRVLIDLASVLDARDRFWSRVRLPNAVGVDVCWEWQGRVDKDGYGVTSVALTGQQSHRIAWILSHERLIPIGMQVLHRCDNPSCCNPSHLLLGTPKDNARDRDVKGRDRWSNP